MLLRNQRMQRDSDLEIIPYTQCPKFIPNIFQITNKQLTFSFSPDENEKCKKGLGGGIHYTSRGSNNILLKSTL